MSKKIPKNAGRKQDGRFSQGQSGNPAGKPKGTRHKATQAAMILLEGETEALTRKAVELALNGDTTALKLCLDRIAPTLKPTLSPINLNMPQPDNLADTARAFITASSNGDLAPDVAVQLVAAVANIARIEEVELLKYRLSALEQSIKD